MMRRAGGVFLTWHRGRRTESLAAWCGLPVVAHAVGLRGGMRHLGGTLISLMYLLVFRPHRIWYQFSFGLGIAVTLYARIAGARVIADIHSKALRRAAPHGTRTLHDVLKRWALQAAEACLVSNSADANHARERFGVRPLVVPDPLPRPHPDAGLPISTRCRADVVFVCSFAVDEPLSLIADVAERLASELSVAVTGDARGLSAGVRARFAPGVLTGYLPEPDYWALLRAARCIVVLSTEPACLPCGAYEAIAVGRRPVLADDPHVRATFGDAAAYSALDASALAHAIRNAASLPSDDALPGRYAAHWARHWGAALRDLTGAPRDEPLRVLHVINPDPFGGKESVVVQLAAAQLAAGTAVRIAASVESEDHPFVCRSIAAGIPVTPIIGRRRAYLREMRALDRLCAREQPTVVHTHGYRADVLGGIVARRCGIATASTAHGPTGGGGRKQVYEWLQRQAFRRTDRIVAVSQPIAEALCFTGLPADRIRIVENTFAPPTPPLDRATARRRLALPPESFVAGWVGRLSPEKGPDVAIDAFARLRNLHLLLVFLGGGARSALEQRARAVDIDDRVRWLGAHENAGTLLSAFDVILVSSRREGTPMVVLEAMMAGVPIIASRVGGIPAMLAGDEALLIPPGDITALADAVRSVYEDPVAAAQRAERARARVRGWSIEAWMARYEAVYRELQQTAWRSA